jgi:hypothetical protein
LMSAFTDGGEPEAGIIANESILSVMASIR